MGFSAQYLKERQQIRDAAKVALKRGPIRTPNGSQITAEMLVDNDKFRKNVIKNSLGYRAFSGNRATPPYWEKTMNGLYAVFKKKGHMIIADGNNCRLLVLLGKCRLTGQEKYTIFNQEHGISHKNSICIKGKYFWPVYSYLFFLYFFIYLFIYLFMSGEFLL